MKRQATNGGRKNRMRPSNLREQISPNMCKAYDEARAENNQVKNWPSPTCSDVYTGNLKSTQQKPGSMHSVTLPQAVAMWPTPAAGLSKGGVTDHYFEHRIENNRQEDVAMAVYKNGDGAVLNPDWTEWLMGWPVGWSNIKPLAELNWRDWKTDPADIYSNDEWPTPSANKTTKSGDIVDSNGNEWNGESKPHSKTTGKQITSALADYVNARGAGHLPQVPRVTDVKENRANRLKAIGNGQVPQCVVKAWELLA
jgi:hypothetical protein